MSVSALIECGEGDVRIMALIRDGKRRPNPRGNSLIRPGDVQLRDALTEGYLSTAGEFLTPEEKSLLPISAEVITLELASRFLTDHLLGDKYFRVKYPEHNLVRARNQLALLKSM